MSSQAVEIKEEIPKVYFIFGHGATPINAEYIDTPKNKSIVTIPHVGEYLALKNKLIDFNK